VLATVMIAVMSVVLCVVLILGGLALAGWGIAIAVGAGRPRNLAGALGAAAGLALALLGAARWLVPGFFWQR
jgi:hypothetical protein